MKKLPVKVHLCGSEKNGWALDTDLALTKEALLSLPGLIELVPMEDAEVVHSVWEEPLFLIDQSQLVGKRIVCHVCNNLLRLYEKPGMIKAADTVGLWIAMSREAERDLKDLHLPYGFVPYSVDTATFLPHVDSDATRKEIQSRYDIPESDFLISNFMRDSFGHDLKVPKDQKGVELLLEIGVSLQNKKIPVHFLLAGPRRHWIRNRLREHSIPFTFIGKEVEEDDLSLNIIDSKNISKLYHASDLHLITSRWEGGPRSILEAAATKTPVLSTKVGIAPDILDEQSLYGSVDEAITKIENHYRDGFLKQTLEPQYQTILDKHRVEKVAPLFEKMYREINTVEPFTRSGRWVERTKHIPTFQEKVRHKIGTVFGIPPRKKGLCISFWHEFHKPPYGGGNQFMLALKDEMERQGVKVVTNKLSRSVDVHICNSCWFDYKKFEKKADTFPVKMIHRIDGPTTLYRGEGRAEDEKIFALNKQLASATVFQSAYSFKESYDLGFRAVSPVVISNGVNRSIFNKNGRLLFDGSRKIRLVSSAWSDNPRKGGLFLKWLDQHLDWDRFEYTFVGRVREQFENIKHIKAVPSEELADLLRSHDIYVSVSLHEPCSNALLEALSCGLPALYRDDGGNPELVSFGGLPFRDESDVLQKLDRLSGNFVSFQNIICLKTIKNIASRYIDLAHNVKNWERSCAGV